MIYAVIDTNVIVSAFCNFLKKNPPEQYKFTIKLYICTIIAKRLKKQKKKTFKNREVKNSLLLFHSEI